ncbi:Putative tRNA 2'-phosphotransferase [Psilocybe cubensis]|uniref:tRNA 2'-phosphotransferase n=2 Tax=Psilocybe cubensis TaxID=181762 RepID=A0ACB8GVH1_PSICU|nr:Putative tRNA 2'-phosphotransferase [Psilocybe cubensis]KAH9479733.1 Putative tRNA 2'-phosphotransferase [Psilocybe cubensis]
MDPTASDSLANLSISGQGGQSSNQKLNSNPGRDKREKGKAKSQKEVSKDGQKQTPKPNPSKSTKLRGLEKDSPEVRISKTLSWLLRHGAQGEGLAMRKDGYVKVSELLENPKLKAQTVDLERIKAMVKADSKQRYDLVLESPDGKKLKTYGDDSEPIPSVTPASESRTIDAEISNHTELHEGQVDKDQGIWWIKARQGHSIKTVQLELKPITSISDIPTGIAVHGTNRAAWQLISKQGLSKMKRNHIHLAQNVAGENVVSGMRTSSQVLIYIDIPKALEAGIKFWLSDNGVVLTEGDAHGILSKEFFSKVVDVKNGELKDWKNLTA